MDHALAAVVFWLCGALFVNANSADLRKPAWTELTAAQRQVLAPLQTEWDRIEPATRKKWVALADRYPKLKPDEQQRIQQRMKDWAKLSPEQRDEARSRFRALSKLAPQKRQEIIRQWTESQEAQQAVPADAPQSPPATTAPATQEAIAEGAEVKAAAPAQ